MIDKKKLIEKIFNTPTKCLNEFSISGGDLTTIARNGILHGCANRQREIIDMIEELVEEHKAPVEHDGCKGCKYESESEESKHCLGCKQNAVDKYEPITNADRIRNMTDEELAKFIHAVGCNSNYGDDCGYPFCHSMKGNLCHGIKDSTDARTLEWLKSEVVKE